MKNLAKIVFITLLANLALNARQNPFIPTQINSQDINTSNVKNTIAPLKSITLKLPSDARELVKVLLVYKGVDGAQRFYNVNAPYSINWHDDLVLSVKANDANKTKNQANNAQNFSQANSAQKNIKEQNTSKQNKPSSIRELMGNNASKYTGEQITTITPKKSVNISFQKRLFIENFSDKIIFKTADSLLRYDIKYENNKTKIIVDFAKKARDYATQTINFENSPLNSVIIGSHGKFYRVVLQLNSKYKTAINKGKNSYILRLK